MTIFFKKIKKSKYIKLIKADTSNNNFKIKLKDYDLVINSENKIFYLKNIFTNKIKKNYKSRAYTFLINHKKISK